MAMTAVYTSTFQHFVYATPSVPSAGGVESTLTTTAGILPRKVRDREVTQTGHKIGDLVKPPAI